MSKPINVEAQRIVKIINDTENRLKTLALFSADFFAEIKTKQYTQEVLSKYQKHLSLAEMFGSKEAAKLILQEVDSENDFLTDNVLTDKMEPLDSDEFTAEGKLKAKVNARRIKQQVTRIVHLFDNKVMQDKLDQFKFQRNLNNEISSFLAVFQQLKALWNKKCGTPKEEEEKNKAQQATLLETVKILETEAQQAQKQFDSFIKQSQEDKTQLEIEIKSLKELKNQKRNQLTEETMKLQELGTKIANQRQNDHQLEYAKLKKIKTELEAKLLKAVQEHQADEFKMLAAFDNIDKSYVEVLRQYDEEMAVHNQDLSNANKVLDEKVHERNQLKSEWEQRVYEKRRYDEMQELVRSKEEELNKKREILNKAAEWVQAHWRGLVARREGEKARKKNKKKKKKK